MVLIAIFCTACRGNNKDKKLKFFNTEHFTEETFYSAVKKYGKKYTSVDGDLCYSLTENQSKAAYGNSSVKVLLTSEVYDSEPKDINLISLWKIMYEDIFSNDNLYTVKSLFETVREKCVWSLTDYGTSAFIPSAESYMSKNDSIINLCKNSGYEIYTVFENEYFNKYGHRLYILDLIDLYIDTDSWVNNNANIAYYSSWSGYYYPLAFESCFWDSPNWRYEGNGYGFRNSSAYQNLVRCVKSYLKEPDSYQSNGSIEFYSSTFTEQSGYYIGGVYVKVPFRAKNSFGGYVADVVWLTYDWNTHKFSWYGSSMPSIINDRPFKTEYVD